MSSWCELLDRYHTFASGLDVERCPPASAGELARLNADAKQLGIVIDPEVIELLRVTNGTSFDGLRFYGAGIGDEDEFGRLDLAKANLLVEERGADTLYGEWQDEFFMRDAKTGRFERRSRTTGDTYYSYATYAELARAVLSEECDLLQQRYGNGQVAP